MYKINFNLPVLVSKWQVTFQPYPFLKKKGSTHYLATDLLGSATSFSDQDFKEFVSKQFERTLPVDTAYDVDDYGKEMLRNYYIHRKKSWSFPEIHKVDEYLVYLPYSIEEWDKKIFLNEITTGMKKKITKNDSIYMLLQRG